MKNIEWLNTSNIDHIIDLILKEIKKFYNWYLIFSLKDRLYSIKIYDFIFGQILKFTGGPVRKVGGFSRLYPQSGRDDRVHEGSQSRFFVLEPGNG